jgi:hypothetical protein
MNKKLFSGISSGPTWDTVLEFSLWNWGKPQKTTVGLTCSMAEIRTKPFPNKIVDCYRYTSRLMLFRETVAVYCENHTEHTNTLCGQNAEFCNIYKSSSYLTGNTLRLRYRAQPVNAVYCANHTKDISTVRGQNAQSFNIKGSDAYCNHFALNG